MYTQLKTKDRKKDRKTLNKMYTKRKQASNKQRKKESESRKKDTD